MQLHPAAAGVIRLPPVARNSAVGTARAGARTRDARLVRAYTCNANYARAYQLADRALPRLPSTLVGATPPLICSCALRRELRLDSLNLKFLEVQLLSQPSTIGQGYRRSFRASLIFASRAARPQFPRCCSKRFTGSYLAEPFDAGDADETRTRYEGAVRPLAQPMLSVPVPQTLKEGGWRIYGLESWICPFPDRHRDRSLHPLSRYLLGWLDDRLALAAHWGGDRKAGH